MTYDLSPLSFRSAFTCTTFEQQLTDSGAEAEPSTQKAWCLRARPRATAAKLRLLLWQLWKCTQMFRRSLWQQKASILICAIWATWGRRLGTVKFPWLQSTAKQSTRQIHYQEPENQSPDGCLLGCHWRSFLICFTGVTAERAPVMVLVFRIRTRSSLWEFAHLDPKKEWHNAMDHYESNFIGAEWSYMTWPLLDVCLGDLSLKFTTASASWSGRSDASWRNLTGDCCTCKGTLPIGISITFFLSS